MDRTKQIAILNDLIAKNYDAEEGYKFAARHVRNPIVKSFFQESAQQRYDFGHELKNHVRNLGGEVQKGDTAIARVHRKWMDIKSSLAHNDEASILQEVKRGEEFALSNFDHALENLEPETSAYKKIADQRNNIGSSIRRLEELMPVIKP